MRFLIAAAALVLVVPGAAQDSASTPAPAPTPALPPPMPDSVVFTLKKPTSYVMPKPVQTIIAVCLAAVPAQAAVWRDEYANIFEDKEDVRKWVDQKLSKVQDIVFYQTGAQIDAANFDQVNLLQNQMQWIKDARRYIKTGW